MTFTPSISTTVWSVSAPRMLSEVVSPGPPFLVSTTPGVRARMSATLVSWSSWICGAVRTVTCWPTWSAGVAERLAVTTTCSTVVAATDPATSGAGAWGWPWAAKGAAVARRKAGRAIRRGILAPSTTSRTRATLADGRPDGDRPARSAGHAISRAQGPYRTTPPGRAKDSCAGQVSWLAGQRLDRRLPKGLDPQWPVTVRLAAYSCGDSRGLAPRSLFTLSRGT